MADPHVDSNETGDEKGEGDGFASRPRGADHCEHVVHADDLEWTEHSHGEQYQVRRRKLAAAAGAKKLGASLYELPAGKAAWPRHAHLANEEAIYVLAGRGTLELGDRQYEIVAGDYVAFPPGVDHAHRLTNTGDQTLRYLCISTMIEPDVMVYPDSGKLGVFAGSPPGGAREERIISSFFRTGDRVDYWDGE